MKTSYFLSQRLGFTNAQAAKIQQSGLNAFLKESFSKSEVDTVPSFLVDAPKSFKEYRSLLKMNEADKKLYVQQERLRGLKLQHWWVDKIYTSPYPLREKMTLFWHNHFVSSHKKVKVAWTMYQQNGLFRDFAFGNFKTLTKRILRDNAMLLYLDNFQNKAKTPNENLSRELLELFTLGVGNYTEQDVKEGAKALAGLSLNTDGGVYYPFWEDNSQKTYLGKTGNWKADDLVDIIFSQPAAPRLLTKKLIKWFMTDDPADALIDEYAAYFKDHNFEIQPFLTKLFSDSRFMESGGAKIKDPLTFILQSLEAFGVDHLPVRSMYGYLAEQDMILFDPPNVKGWDGGRSWLSSQKLIQRCNVVELLVLGQKFSQFKPKKIKMEDEELKQEEEEATSQIISFKWDRTAKKNKDIIKDLTDRFVVSTNQAMQEDLEKLLRYDFEPQSESADLAVIRTAEFVMKSPEFQIY